MTTISARVDEKIVFKAYLDDLDQKIKNQFTKRDVHVYATSPLRNFTYCFAANRHSFVVQMVARIIRCPMTTVQESLILLLFIELADMFAANQGEQEDQ